MEAFLFVLNFYEMIISWRFSRFSADFFNFSAVSFSEFVDVEKFSIPAAIWRTVETIWSNAADC